MSVCISPVSCTSRQRDELGFQEFHHPVRLLQFSIGSWVTVGVGGKVLWVITRPAGIERKSDDDMNFYKISNMYICTVL